MKAIVIETAKPKSASLGQLIEANDIRVDILLNLTSAEEAAGYFRNHPQPDILFMEFDPEQGLGLNFFSAVEVACPVVFILPPDRPHPDIPLPNCIDVLTTPVDPYHLRKCVQHYHELQDFFIRNYSSLFEHFNGKEKLKSRILIKKGTEFQTSKIADVAYFFSDRKRICLVDKENKKYLTASRSLSELQMQLDPDTFCRANRKFIVNVNYIQAISMVNSGRIRLKLSLSVNEPIFISQQNTSLFKQWMGERL